MKNYQGLTKKAFMKKRQIEGELKAKKNIQIKDPWLSERYTYLLSPELYDKYVNKGEDNEIV